MRAILFLHRYLAVAVGLLLTLWCLSGFVMMYQSYPGFDSDELLKGLEPLDLASCCNEVALPPGDAEFSRFRIEMLRGEPVIRLGAGGRGGASAPVSLRTGAPVPELSAAAVFEVAETYARNHGIAGEIDIRGPVGMDQWTVQSAHRNQQPIYKARLGDAADHVLYISGTSGLIFQDTNRRERMLSWIGAIPHWTYPTILRQNGELWTRVVVWACIIGTFLAITGLYIGISRFRRSRDGRLRSPYRGWWYWHHISGLIFGVLTLTWVYSGMLTMGYVPWEGLFDGRAQSVSAYSGQLTQGGSWMEVRQFLAAVRANPAPYRAYTQIEPAPFDGQLYLLAHSSDGTTTRLDSHGRPVDVSAVQAAEALEGVGLPVSEFMTLESEDSYYYGHKRAVELPVYRVLLDDREETRLYISPETGSVRAVDSGRRFSRWVRTGLHDMDFPGLRQRPVWDVVVILLLLGVTAVCITGTWMALKRLWRDGNRVRMRFRKWNQKISGWRLHDAAESHGQTKP